MGAGTEVLIVLIIDTRPYHSAFLSSNAQGRRFPSGVDRYCGPMWRDCKFFNFESLAISLLHIYTY